MGESYRIRLTRCLVDLREDDERHQLEFPATLTNTERKFVHELAMQLGLKSKSTGKGEDRKIVVSKLNQAPHKANQSANGSNDTDNDIPLLNVGPKGKQALQRHLIRFPPSHLEDLEAHETGRSLLEALHPTNDNDHTNYAAITAILQQIMGLTIHDDDHASPVVDEFRTLRRGTADVGKQRQRNHGQSQEAKRHHPGYHKMQALRRQLPAHHHEQEIVRAVAEHAVTIVSGETGCGKYLYIYIYTYIDYLLCLALQISFLSLLCFFMPLPKHSHTHTSQARAPKSHNSFWTRIPPAAL